MFHIICANWKKRKNEKTCYCRKLSKQNRNIFIANATLYIVNALVIHSTLCKYVCGNRRNLLIVRKRCVPCDLFSMKVTNRNSISRCITKIPANSNRKYAVEVKMIDCKFIGLVALMSINVKWKRLHAFCNIDQIPSP